MKKKENKVIKYFKSIPWYGYFFGLIIIGIQTMFYGIAYGIAKYGTSHWFIIEPMIMDIDGHIPLIPFFFAEIYLLWPVLVPLGGVVSGRQQKDKWINLFLAWITAIVVGSLIFIFCPSQLDKTNCPGVPGGNIFEYISQMGDGWSKSLIGFIHSHQPGRNVFPSFHCINIIFCYFGVARRKDVNLAHRIGQLTITILICISTVLVKQHFFADIILGLFIATLCFLLIKLSNPAKSILKKCPNFLIIKKLNWTHEKIVPLDKKNKGDVKIEKVG